MTPAKLLVLQRPSWMRLNPNNMLAKPKQFDDAAWIKGTTATVAADAIAGPDGLMTADKLVESATSSAHLAYQTVTTAVRTYVMQATMRAAERTRG
jgi:hypothetical protein